MKKVISALLAFLLIFSTSVSAYASDTENLNTITSKCFIYNGHGEFTSVKSNVLTNIFANDSLNNLAIGKKIIALPTQDKEFYQILITQQYLVACTDDKYILTDKVSVDKKCVSFFMTYTLF